MTSAQHKAEAERVAGATKSDAVAFDEGFVGWNRADLLALAQLHATLATLATVQPRAVPGVR